MEWTLLEGSTGNPGEERPCALFSSAWAPIGRRHLRIFRELLPGLEALAWRSGLGRPVEGVACFERLVDALGQKPDFALVATPTALHVPTFLALAQAGAPFLLEKPVSALEEGLGELAWLVSAQKLPVLVGF